MWIIETAENYSVINLALQQNLKTTKVGLGLSARTLEGFKKKERKIVKAYDHLFLFIISTKPMWSCCESEQKYYTDYLIKVTWDRKESH